MNKLLFNLAFLTGACAVIWVGFGFIDSSALAMAMTALIFAVYLVGAFELHRFRQATASLTTALGAIPENLTDLNGFVSGVDGSLQHPVRLRIEGERASLPGPSLTPYLVGLLVMLGMLGTFLGMVVTLKGAVFTLEKTADLEAMRSALAVPVKGLGLAFGTSVAGVAASAVLGLMSALCRRERMQASQLLDATAATVLGGFSHARQREQTFRALQSQSEALPQVVDKLQEMMQQIGAMSEQLNQRLLASQEKFHSSASEAYTELARSVDTSLRDNLASSTQAASESIKPVVEMMLQIGTMSEQLNQRLLANQEQFHSSASATYTELARSVDTSLRDSLATSAQAAGESIRPVFEATMQGIAQEARTMHERTAGTVQQQLDGLAERFSAATVSVAETWNAALDSQQQANRSLATELGQSLEAFSASFDQRAGALVATVGEAYAGHQTGQAEQDAQRQQAWTQSLEAMAATFTRELQESGTRVLAQQQEICTAVTHAVRELADQAQTGAGKSLEETARLVTTAEDLMRSRITAEAQWLDQHSESMDQLAGLLRDELGALRKQEAEHDAHRHQAWTQSLETMAATLTRELQESGTQVLAQQQEICTVVTHAVRQLADQAQAGAGKSLEETARLVTTAEDLMRSRITAEAQWLDQHSESMDRLAGLLQDELGALRKQEAAHDAQRHQAWTQSLETMAATLTRELQESGTQVLAQQQEICTAVTHAVRELADQAQAGAGKSLEETARLVTTAEDLMHSRIAAEAQWLDQHRERMQQLAGMLQAELGALRQQEAERGDAAVAHLGELQSAVTTHLTTLGAALEAPITRLIETAAEAPRAAAEVIGQMRQEISHSVARDNALLEERSRIMETLNALLDVINHASTEQRAVIDSLVASSSDKLDAASTAFSANVASESGKLSEIAANVTSSAVDVASLADAFGVAVQSFNEANEKLATNLDRIEVALDKSMSRSDGQLAYYVAQAREIIDLSMSSQKSIVEELRQLPAMLADEGK